MSSPISVWTVEFQMDDRDNPVLQEVVLTEAEALKNISYEYRFRKVTPIAADPSYPGVYRVLGTRSSYHLKEWVLGEGE